MTLYRIVAFTLLGIATLGMVAGPDPSGELDAAGAKGVGERVSLSRGGWPRCERIGCGNVLPPPVRRSGRRRRFCTNACAVNADRPPVRPGAGAHPSRHPWASRAFVVSWMAGDTLRFAYGTTPHEAEERARSRVSRDAANRIGEAGG